MGVGIAMDSSRRYVLVHDSDEEAGDDVEGTGTPAPTNPQVTTPVQNHVVAASDVGASSSTSIAASTSGAVAPLKTASCVAGARAVPRKDPWIPVVTSAGAHVPSTSAPAGVTAPRSTSGRERASCGSDGDDDVPIVTRAAAPTQLAPDGSEDEWEEVATVEVAGDDSPPTVEVVHSDTGPAVIFSIPADVREGDVFPEDWLVQSDDAGADAACPPTSAIAEPPVKVSSPAIVDLASDSDEGTVKAAGPVAGTSDQADDAAAAGNFVAVPALDDDESEWRAWRGAYDDESDLLEAEDCEGDAQAAVLAALSESSVRRDAISSAILDASRMT